MSLEIIRQVTQVETDNRERKTAAEAEARQIVANAQQAGLALLQQVREAAAESGKELLKQAEARAASQAAEIDHAAKEEGDTLRRAAGEQLDAAADFIVGRVVEH